MNTFLKRGIYDPRLQHQLVVILLSLVASHFVVIHTTSEHWLDLLQYEYYYVAVAASMAIAFLLINYIWYISVKLNQWHSGFHLSKNRVIKQLVYGIGGAALLELFLAMLLYWFKDVDMIADDYFGKLFIFIMLFIVLVNISYCFYFYHHEQKNIKSETVVITEVKTEIRYKFVAAVVPQIDIALQEPGIIYLEKKVPLAYNAKGELLEWNYNLSQSIAILPERDYFQINKSCIIHRAIIKELKSNEGDHVLIIPFVQLPIELYTSRRRTTLFKEWLVCEDWSAH